MTKRIIIGVLLGLLVFLILFRVSPLYALWRIDHSWGVAARDDKHQRELRQECIKEGHCQP